MPRPTTRSVHDVVLATPLAELRLGLRFADAHLAGIEFLGPDAELRRPQSPAQQAVVDEIQAYFARPGHRFQMSLQLEGSPFQQRVWQALRRIPVGDTLTYGALAARLGSSARAVGSACRSNRLPLVIPCHRVVAKAGLGGFMGQTRGSGLALKQWLLAHERRSDDG